VSNQTERELPTVTRLPPLVKYDKLQQIMWKYSKIFRQHL